MRLSQFAKEADVAEEEDDLEFGRALFLRSIEWLSQAEAKDGNISFPEASKLIAFVHRLLSVPASVSVRVRKHHPSDVMRRLLSRQRLVAMAGVLDTLSFEPVDNFPNYQRYEFAKKIKWLALDAQRRKRLTAQEATAIDGFTRKLMKEPGPSTKIRKHRPSDVVRRFLSPT